MTVFLKLLHSSAKIIARCTS